MRLLLDTHYAIELIDRSLNPQTDRGHAAITGDNTLNFVSVASLWEAAIKFRLGKLPVRTPVEEWPALLRVLRVPGEWRDRRLDRILGPLDGLILVDCGAQGPDADLGVLRKRALSGDGDKTAEEAMDAGPVTFRPNELLAQMALHLSQSDVEQVLVTTSDGELLGVLDRGEALRRSGASTARAVQAR